MDLQYVQISLLRKKYFISCSWRNWRSYLPVLLNILYSYNLQWMYIFPFFGACKKLPKSSVFGFFRKLSKQWRIFMGYLHCLRNHPNHNWWQITITKFQLSSGNQAMLFFMHPHFTDFITYQEKCERISHKRRCRGGKDT